MNVGIAYAKHSAQFWIRIEVPDGATVQQAIDHSDVLQQFPEIDLSVNKVGIFGRISKLSTVLKNGERVEIYRPIHPEAELLDSTRQAETT